MFNPIAQLVISCMDSIAEMNRNQIKTRAMEGIKVAQHWVNFKAEKLELSKRMKNYCNVTKLL